MSILSRNGQTAISAPRLEMSGRRPTVSHRSLFEQPPSWPEGPPRNCTWRTLWVWANRPFQRGGLGFRPNPPRGVAVLPSVFGFHTTLVHAGPERPPLSALPFKCASFLVNLRHPMGRRWCSAPRRPRRAWPKRRGQRVGRCFFDRKTQQTSDLF